MRKPGTSANLTAAQVMGYLQSYVDSYGYPPSFREMAEFFGVSLTAIGYWINRLDLLGYIERPKATGDGIYVRRSRPSRALKILKRIEGHEYELG